MISLDGINRTVSPNYTTTCWFWLFVVQLMKLVMKEVIEKPDDQDILFLCSVNKVSEDPHSAPA